MRRIDWSSPANVLEKIIDYEAVHEINGWDDLRSRLARIVAALLFSTRRWRTTLWCLWRLPY